MMGRQIDGSRFVNVVGCQPARCNHCMNPAERNGSFWMCKCPDPPSLERNAGLMYTCELNPPGTPEGVDAWRHRWSLRHGEQHKAVEVTSRNQYPDPVREMKPAISALLDMFGDA